MRRLSLLVLILASAGAACTANGGQVCGGPRGVACPAETFCDLPAGHCRSADLQGTCAAKPDLCTKELKPVCGCDGKAYGNDCARRAAGVSKDHDGACEKGS